ncbi:MAG: hypothetical protein Q7V15_15595 [Phenylobacterium sp.]|uniref:hypothetical protein n=1 Tax=Phenylobacterium sp. TaxID=1871053 RepID=UPI0027218795|nr:hypothetical protein [Phenylobacterium sp.]MDO8902768.1 hypothetical protein [Phenylobacterium sp.]MDP2213623.1 hypothetical protein [Phenylobacterium sp.]
MIAPPPPEASPQQVAIFIEEVLRDLSEVAAIHGHRGLATTLIVAALEAARASAGEPDTKT